VAQFCTQATVNFLDIALFPLRLHATNSIPIQGTSKEACKPNRATPGQK
jgi:hypothetical protein